MVCGFCGLLFVGETGVSKYVLYRPEVEPEVGGCLGKASKQARGLLASKHDVEYQTSRRNLLALYTLSKAACRTATAVRQQAGKGGALRLRLRLGGGGTVLCFGLLSRGGGVVCLSVC